MFLEYELNNNQNIHNETKIIYNKREKLDYNFQKNLH